ncbi:lipopolysaccharide biosynthesis protein [Alishewanella sp. d11]|uniref:lipopolysaccharide biosynthesis protein n=1 Tax=Alishewanella sp. d11 TaxID=3414030 RepID=UPI003BF797BB
MKSKFLIAIVDQFGFSISSFLFFIYVARNTNVEQLAEFSVCVALSILFQGVQRNLIIIPLMTSGFLCSNRRFNYYYSFSTFLSVFISFLAIFIFILYALYTDADVFINVVFVFLYVFCSWNYEFKRRRCWLLLDYKAIFQSVFLLIFTLSFFCLFLDSSKYVIFYYPLSLLVAVIPFGFKEKVHSISVGSFLKRFKERKFEISSGFLYGFYNNFLIVLSGLFFGPASAAFYSVARNLLQPVQVLISAIDSFDKKDLSLGYHKYGVKFLFSSILRMSLICLFASFLYFIVIFYNYSFLNEFLFDGKYVDIERLLLLSFFSYVFMIFGHFLENGLYICKLGESLFFNRLAASITSFFILLLASGFFGYFSIPLAMLAGWFVIVLFSLKIILNKVTYEG